MQWCVVHLLIPTDSSVCCVFPQRVREDTAKYQSAVPHVAPAAGVPLPPHLSKPGFTRVTAPHPLPAQNRQPQLPQPPAAGPMRSYHSSATHTHHCPLTNITSSGMHLAVGLIQRPWVPHPPGSSSPIHTPTPIQHNPTYTTTTNNSTHMDLFPLLLSSRYVLFLLRPTALWLTAVAALQDPHTRYSRKGGSQEYISPAPPLRATTLRAIRQWRLMSPHRLMPNVRK